MPQAVAQLPVIDIGPLVALPGLFLYDRNLLSLLLAVLDLLLDDRYYVGMNMEVIVQVLGHEVVDECPDSRSVLQSHCPVRLLHLLFPGIDAAELHLGLRLEVRFLNLNADRADYAHAAVLRGVVFLEEFFQGLGNRLPVGREMGASVAGVLAVDKRADVFAVGVAVGENYLNVIAFQMDRRVERSLADVFVHEVQQTVFGLVWGAVENKCKTLLEVRIVLDHSLDKVEIEAVLAEHHLVREEFYECAVLLLRL